jgi:hypothetical protein
MIVGGTIAWCQTGAHSIVVDRVNGEFVVFAGALCGVIFMIANHGPGFEDRVKISVGFVVRDKEGV